MRQSASHHANHCSTAPGAARRRRHVEALVVQAADRAVVHDPPGVRGEHAVADAPGFEVREAVGVEAIEEGAGLGPAHDELAQRGDVDEPRASWTASASACGSP
jgi:hypothetical protein